MKHNVLISFSFQDHAQPQGDLRYDLYGVEYIDATVLSIFPQNSDYILNTCVMPAECHEKLCQGRRRIFFGKPPERLRRRSW